MATEQITWEVFFFQTARGDYPVKDFVGQQDPMIRSKIALSILLLKNQGPFLKPPYTKKLQDKLYELRISGTTQIRIFYTIYQSKYYLLHAFRKKTQKTPNKELKIAVDRMEKII